MATVPHSPATAPRAELIETIVRKHSVSFVLWRGTAPAAACSTVSPAPTLHSLLLLAFSVIKVLYHHYCSSVGIHEKQIQIWSIRFDNDQFEGSVCEPVSCVGCDDVSRFCASVAPNYDRGPVSLVLALFLLVLCVA